MYLGFLILGGACHALAQQVVLDSHYTSETSWTVFNKTINRVAVIGAGISGLQIASTLQNHNFSVRLFDRAPEPGGNWLYSEEIPVRESYPDEPIDKRPWLPEVLPAVKYYKDGDEGISLNDRWREHWQPRPIWNSLHTNSPAVITNVPGVPYPDDHSWVISAHTIGAHVRAYATLNKLNSNDNSPSLAYSTRVENLTKTGDVWTVAVRHLQRLEESNRIRATWWTEDFDAVVVATGPYDAPHVPDIDGLVEWSKVRSVEDPSRFSVYHSRVYRNPERYTGKTVLVVGAGTSGSEIARDIAPFAKHVYASHKKYDWNSLHPFQRRSFRRFPAEAEFIPQISSFEPLTSSSNGIKDGKIVLVNGTVLQGIDEVILATGYNRINKFLRSVLNQTLDHNAHVSTVPIDDVFTGKPLPNVHWTGLYIPDPTLAFPTVRPWTAQQYQSLGFAKVWEGSARLPNTEELWRQYNSTRYSHFRGLFGTGPSEAIIRQYVAWLNNESLELGGRLVAPWPVQNWEVFAYYANQEWEKDYITKENFTRFENLPADQWTSTDVWDVSVLEDESW